MSMSTRAVISESHALRIIQSGCLIENAAFLENYQIRYRSERALKLTCPNGMDNRSGIPVHVYNCSELMRIVNVTCDYQKTCFETVISRTPRELTLNITCRPNVHL